MYIERLSKDDLIEYTEQVIHNDGSTVNRDDFTKTEIHDEVGRVKYIALDYSLENEEDEIRQSAIVKDYDLKKGNLKFFIDIFGYEYIESFKSYLKSGLKQAQAIKQDAEFEKMKKECNKAVKFCNQYFETQQNIKMAKEGRQTQLQEFF